MAALVVGKQATCWKCGGTGDLPWARHYANGVCFMCSGAGCVPAGRPVSHKGVTVFQGPEFVWVFAPLCKEGFPATSKAATVTVMIYAFRAGINRRSGVVDLICRLKTEFAREVYKLAQAGLSPADLTDDVMGVERDWRGHCGSVGRDCRGRAHEIPV